MEWAASTVDDALQVRVRLQAGRRVLVHSGLRLDHRSVRSARGLQAGGGRGVPWRAALRLTGGLPRPGRTGHSYLTYGPLLNGATSLVFEGIPTYPDAGRWWQIVDKYKARAAMGQSATSHRGARGASQPLRRRRRGRRRRR